MKSLVSGCVMSSPFFQLPGLILFMLCQADLSCLSCEGGWLNSGVSRRTDRNSDPCDGRFQVPATVRRGIVLPFVEKGGGFGNFGVVVKIEMAQGWHPVAVRSLVLNHQHEGLVLLSFVLEPIHRQISNHVRAIPIDPSSSVRENHVGVVIQSLSRQDSPVIITLRFALEVTLSVYCGLIAGLLQKLGEGLLVPIKGISVVHEAILVAMFAGLNDGPAGPANRIRTEAVDKQHAFGCKPVDDGSRID